MINNSSRYKLVKPVFFLFFFIEEEKARCLRVGLKHDPLDIHACLDKLKPTAPHQS